jgi:Asp-tRNA(Asn)/Glu-tRNA(Gln) amidotransferase A subunit family amidase
LFTALPACLDWPATAIPAGTTADGLPLSLMVIGPDDERCLTVAALIEPA